MFDCILEALEERLCLSTTRHHFYTGVRAHFIAAEVHHSRHHFHTGVRAHATALTNPPAAFGQIRTVNGNPSGIFTPPGTGMNTGLFNGGTSTGLFGGGTSTGLFGGGTIFA
jgi:hypothetical protein